MDAKVVWNIVDDVESLVSSINECKKALTSECFLKYGRAKIVECEVFTSNKISSLLEMSSEFKPTKLKKSERKRPGADVVGDFDSFVLHKGKIMNDSNIRVTALFDTDEGIPRMWYGNVELKSCTDE